MKKKSFISVLFIFTTLLLVSQTGSSRIESIAWQKGLSIGRLGEIASIRVPIGFMFAGEKDSKTLMEEMHNPLSGNELGFISPESLAWYVVFEYDEVGYIKDDEKNSLDSEAILKAIRKGDEKANKERRKRGWATVKILGWIQEPHYDETTHNLEWAFDAKSGGETIVNYNTRILGRGGVMRATLVIDPENLSEVLPAFKELIDGFEYNMGHTYAEFKSGDKLAKYGLTTLMVGGATAIALKTGLFKWLWKGLILLLAAIGGFFKKLFRKKDSNSFRG